MTLGYVLQAFIAEEPVLRRAAEGLANAHIVPLRRGFALIPLTDALDEEIIARLSDSEVQGSVGDSWIYASAVRWAVASSSHGPIAYVEADFFGGTGSQEAVVARDGAITFGPKHSDNFAGSVKASPLRKWAINGALSHLGVRAVLFSDEFNAVGLGRCRETEDWLAV
jgi:hypothetical protein